MIDFGYQNLFMPINFGGLLSFSIPQNGMFMPMNSIFNFQTPISLPAFPTQTVTNYNLFTVPQITLPKLDFSNISLGSFNRKPQLFNTNINLPTLNSAGYNADKAFRLASAAERNAHSSSTGYCAKSVKEAIALTGLGSYKPGHACDMAGILNENKNFKEVDVKGNDLKDLPAGCVIVYPKGAAGYSSEYGHVEIALGDGRAASDFVNSSVKSSERARVFVPV